MSKATRLFLGLGAIYFLSAQTATAATTPVRPASFPLPRPNVVGALVGWGDNTYGAAAVPAEVRSNLVAVVAGGYANIGLLPDGRVTPWGFGAFGQNQVPTAATNVVSLAAGNGHFLVLRADGAVVSWGDPADGRTAVPAGLSNVVAVAAGGGHSLVLKADGTVQAWGWNSDGQTIVPPGLSNVVAIAGGYRHSVALKEDGTVVAWGANQSGQVNVPSGLTNVVAIEGGGGIDEKGDITMALKGDGSLTIWGDSSKGQLNVPAGLTNVVSISCGYYYAAAVDKAGKIWVWGTTNGGEGNIPADSKATLVSGGNFHVLAFNAPVLPPTQASGTPQVVNGFVVGINIVDAGAGYTVAPTVQIVGGNGTGATATATIANGSITGFTITNPGSGYTGTPTIIIGAPNFVESLAVAFSKIKVTMHVLVNATYLLESSGDLVLWTPAGSPFIAMQSELEQEFPIANTNRFYRLTRQ